MEKIKKNKTYRNSEPTTSVLTITSNVVYGKATGALPDGRPAYTPFAPGASPSYGAEKSGLLASLNSVAKLPYHWALDGISNTQTINPEALGHSEEERKENLVQVLDGYIRYQWCGTCCCVAASSFTGRILRSKRAWKSAGFRISFR